MLYTPRPRCNEKYSKQHYFVTYWYPTTDSSIFLNNMCLVKKNSIGERKHVPRTYFRGSQLFRFPLNRRRIATYGH